MCGWVLKAQPHEVILDMCAAPGNKTTHMAEMSNNQVSTELSNIVLLGVIFNLCIDLIVQQSAATLLT